MSDAVAPAARRASPAARRASPARAAIARHGRRATVIGVLVGIVVCLAYAALSVRHDVRTSGSSVHSFMPWVLLAAALVIALGFEFVNGFHDTANAVATVIYTHSMPPTFAVVWSGLFNFLGVLQSSGAVAFSVITLLPVQLVVQVGSGTGFAVVFALLLAAIVWNLSTWALGLPASSSHTLIGSIIGVGLGYELFVGGGAGVDWSQATKIGWSLLLSPLIGFTASAALLWLGKRLLRKPELFVEPKDGEPPPAWIRGLLVLTCTGVSFAHGSNDGQKGMGLIMLILIGIVPTAYALNHALPDDEVGVYRAVFSQAAEALDRVGTTRSGAAPAVADIDVARTTAMRYLDGRQRDASIAPALATMTRDLAQRIGGAGNLRDLRDGQAQNVRNDMYVVSEDLKLLLRDRRFASAGADRGTLTTYRKELERATQYIPVWVKVAVAFALGLGTMVGWRRIVVTVGEKIGNTHLTYGQGASAELVAAATIGAADLYGLPVSTTHVLSSGVAGTMAASGSGLRWATIRNLLLAWFLTLPVAIGLSMGFFWLFLKAV